MQFLSVGPPKHPALSDYGVVPAVRCRPQAEAACNDGSNSEPCGEKCRKEILSADVMTVCSLTSLCQVKNQPTNRGSESAPKTLYHSDINVEAAEHLGIDASDVQYINAQVELGAAPHRIRQDRCWPFHPPPEIHSPKPFRWHTCDPVSSKLRVAVHYRNLHSSAEQQSPCPRPAKPESRAWHSHFWT